MDREVGMIMERDEAFLLVIDVQEKLHATIGRNRKKAAIGIYPLEKISLPIKFEARKQTRLLSLK